MEPTPAVPFKVLIVDDDPRILVTVAAGLRYLGHFEVYTAKNGIEGLEQCYLVQPDCMVIDVRMPGLDGYQLVRVLRGDATTMHIPLVMLTAMAQDKDRFAGLAAGVDQYLLKPVKPTDLVAAIQRTIDLTALEREQRQRDLALAADAGKEEQPT